MKPKLIDVTIQGKNILVDKLLRAEEIDIKTLYNLQMI